MANSKPPARTWRCSDCLRILFHAKTAQTARLAERAEGSPHGLGYLGRLKPRIAPTEVELDRRVNVLNRPEAGLCLHAGPPPGDPRAAVLMPTTTLVETSVGRGKPGFLTTLPANVQNPRLSAHALKAVWARVVSRRRAQRLLLAAVCPHVGRTQYAAGRILTSPGQKCATALTKSALPIRWGKAVARIEGPQDNDKTVA